MKKYDAIIIGFGKGGKALAGQLASLGETVAMIERSDEMYGGTCINKGCIPSKSLIDSAKLSSFVEDASYGERMTIYAQAVMEKNRLTAMLRREAYDKLNDNPNVTIYNGTAGFLSSSSVQVKSASDTFELAGTKIFINTGSRPAMPEIEGLAGNPYVYTSETIMDLEKLPRRLVIIGGGFIGTELASMYANFGSEVVLLQKEERFAPKEDPDMAEEIKKVMEKQGIEFKLGSKVQSIADKGDHAEVTYSWNGGAFVVRAEAVLVATGRRPDTEDLNPAAAGIELAADGAIKTDELLRTTAPNIWAMGDVTGGAQFTYLSMDDFRIIWSQLGGGVYRPSSRKNIPYSLFINPAFSRIGQNEEEAVAAGRSVEVAKLPASAVLKSQVLKHPVGLLKAVIDAETHKILGAALFCEESYEMINLIKLAMDLDVDYTMLRDQVFTHPTMSEAFNDLFAVLVKK